MEFKKVTREWDTLKKDAMERAKNAAPLVKEGKIVDAKIQLLCWKLLSNLTTRLTSKATTKSKLTSWQNACAKLIPLRFMICTWFNPC